MKIFDSHTIITHTSAVYCIAGGPDEGTFFSGGGDQYVVQWQMQPLQQLPFVVKLEKPVYAVHFIQKFGLLVAGNSAGEIHVIDFLNKKEIHHLIHHTKGIYDFAFDASDNILIVAGGDGVLSIWSVPDFKLIRSIPLCSEKIRQLSISDDNNLVAIACGDGVVRILDLVFYNETGTIEAHEGGATAVAWHPEKPVLITGGKDAHLRCWNISDNYNPVMSVAAHQFAIYSIVFHSSGNFFASASRDKTIKIWDSLTFDPIIKIGPGDGAHTHSVNKLLWLKSTIISCSDDKRIATFEMSM